MENLRRLKLLLVAAAVMLASASIANSTSTQSDWTSISDPVSSTSITGLAADTTSLTEPETTKGDSSAAAITSSSSSSSSTTSTTTTTPAVTSESTITTPAVTSSTTVTPAVTSSTTTTPTVTSESTTITPAVTSESTITTTAVTSSTTTTTPAVTSSTTVTPAVTSSTTTTPAVTSSTTATPAVTSSTTTTPAVTSTPTTTTTTSNTPSADLQSTTQETQLSGIDESSSLSTESTTTTTPKSTMTPERGTLPLNIWNQLRISLSVKLLNTSQSRDEIRDGLIIPSFGSCPAYLFSTVDEPTVSTNQRDPIFTFHVTYDAKPLIFTKSATVENVTSCMDSSLQEWKQSLLTYDGFNFDVDYLDTVTLKKLYDEGDRMGELVSNPCTIRHVCPNECYSCSQTLLECSFNFTCSGAREHSTCMLDDVGKPYCGCPYRFVEFGGKCVHQKDKLSLLLGSVGGGILGFCILLSGFCIASVTWGKSTSMATRTYLPTMPQGSNAFEPHNCKTTKTSNDDPGFYNVAFSTKEETLKPDISSGVRLRVADLDGTKSSYSTFQDRSTNLHPYSTTPDQESKGNVYSTSSSGGIKDEAKDPIVKEEAREEMSTF